eukprot:2684511-Pleurochrysis_carterae.AAC.3
MCVVCSLPCAGRRRCRSQQGVASVAARSMVAPPTSIVAKYCLHRRWQQNVNFIVTVLQSVIVAIDKKSSAPPLGPARHQSCVAVSAHSFFNYCHVAANSWLRR